MLVGDAITAILLPLRPCPAYMIVTGWRPMDPACGSGRVAPCVARSPILFPQTRSKIQLRGYLPSKTCTNNSLVVNECQSLPAAYRNVQ